MIYHMWTPGDEKPEDAGNLKGLQAFNESKLRWQDTGVHVSSWNQCMYRWPVEQPEQPEQRTAAHETSILEEAQELIHGDRHEDYGHPFKDFSKTARLWSVVLGVDVTPEQVALCMVCLKISRELHRPKRDNIVDAAGYLGTLEMVLDYRKASKEGDG